MSTEELYSRCQSAFAVIAPQAGIRLTMSARRDLLARAMFGVAHSQAMARARAGAGEDPSSMPMIDLARLRAVAADFGVEPGTLLDGVVGCVPAFRKLYEQIVTHLAAPGIVAIVGQPEPGRDNALAVATLAIIRSRPRGVHGAYRTRPVANEFVQVQEDPPTYLPSPLHGYATRDAAAETGPEPPPAAKFTETVISRKPRVAYRPYLQSLLPTLSRLDNNTIVWDSVDSPALVTIADEVAASASRTVVVFDLLEYVDAFVRELAPDKPFQFIYPWGGSYKVYTTIAGEFRPRGTRQFASVIDQAVHIASEITADRGVALTDLSDADWRRALLVVHDCFGTIRTPARVPQIGVGNLAPPLVSGMSQLDRAAIQLRNALVVEGVSDEQALQAIVRRVMPLVP